MIISKYKLILILAAAMLGLGDFSAIYAAEESGWVVVAVEGGAWKSSDRDPSVRTALHAGEVVGAHDRVETFQRNRVTLAQDPAGKNLVAVQGDFHIQQSPGVTRVRLDRGQALAVLDGLKGQGDFSVTTPTGVAVVRGTRFLVVTDPIKGMEVQTFLGEVAVRGFASQKRRATNSIPLPKGSKVLLSEADASSGSRSGDLTAADWKLFRESFGAIKKTRAVMRLEGKRWFEDSQKPSRSRFVSNDDAKKLSLEGGGQTIVF